MTAGTRSLDGLPVLGVTFSGTRVFLALSIVITVLTVPPVAARVWVRRVTSTRYRIEDVLVFVAFFLQISLFIIDLFVIFYGAAGVPQHDVSGATVVASLKLLVAQGLVYGTLMGCSKMSILFLYKRIFSTKGFRMATHVGMFLVMGYALWAILAVFALCVPVAANWDDSIPGARCGDRPLALTMVGVLDAITDGYILILPLPVVFQLRISLLKKLSLVAVFGIGLFSLSISICRTYYASRVVYTNFTQSRALLDILTILEGGSSVIVASTLGLGPLVQRVSCCGMRGSRHHSSGNQRYQYSFRRRAVGGDGGMRAPGNGTLLSNFFRMDAESIDNEGSIDQPSTLYELNQVTVDCRGPPSPSRQGGAGGTDRSDSISPESKEAEDIANGIIVKREVCIKEDCRK